MTEINRLKESKDSLTKQLRTLISDIMVLLEKIGEKNGE